MALWWMTAWTAAAGFVVDAEPSPVSVGSYKLPEPVAEWIDPEAPAERRCSLDVRVADGAVTAEAAACPEVMAPACIASTLQWTVDGGEGAFVVTYVMKYSGVVGALTLHAQVDPGLEGAQTGVRGPPGVKLVHRAVATKRVVPKMPKAATKTGLDGVACLLRLLLDDRGRPAQTAAVGCPDEVVKVVEKAGKRWRYTPRYVDGYPVPIEVLEAVTLR